MIIHYWRMYIDKFEMFRKLPEKFMKEHRNGEKELNDKSYRGNDVPPGHETGVVFPVAPTLSVLLFVLLVYVLMIPSSSPTSLSSIPVNVIVNWEWGSLSQVSGINNSFNASIFYILPMFGDSQLSILWMWCSFPESNQWDQQQT